MARSHTTLTVGRDTAEKVRKFAHDKGITAHDAANGLLEFALKHAVIEVEKVVQKFTLKDWEYEDEPEPSPVEKPAPRKRRGRPSKK